jgi:restriction endonuclease S subunit
MQYSVINKDNLWGAFRLDAECYKKEFSNVQKEIESYQHITLGDVSFITDGQHGYHKVDPNSDIKHLTAKCLKDGFVEFANTDRLHIDTHKKNLRSSLVENDVLIGTAGTIGNVGLVTKDVLPANMDQDMARVHIKNSSEINPSYLMVFLKTRLGKLQMMRETTGQVQQHLALEKVKKIKVPILPIQFLIEEIVKKSFTYRQNSFKSYSDAERLLLKELNLVSWQPWHCRYFTSNFCDTQNANRIDAEYFQPPYKDLISHIKRNGVWNHLGKLVEIRKFKFTPKDNVEYKYIELANINNTIGEVTGFIVDLGINLPTRARQKVQKGDIIVSSIEGSLSSCALITDEYDGCLCSTGFHILRSRYYNPATLLCLM